MTEPNDNTSQASGNADTPPVLPYATPEPAVPSNTMAACAIGCAIAFPVIGAMGCGGLMHLGLAIPLLVATAITAIVCGTKGMNPRGSMHGRGVAQSARALGIVSLAFLAFVAIVLPFTGGSRDRVRRVQCANQLRSIGQMLQLYASDHAGAMPPDLGVLITAAALDPAMLVCPSSNDTPAIDTTPQAVARKVVSKKGFCSYIYVAAGRNAKVILPDEVIAYERCGSHDEDGVNVLFGNGHVGWMDRRNAEHLLAELAAGHNPPRPRAATTRP